MAIGCNDWITPTERRMKMISLICKKRYITMNELASEFGVTIRTIRNDIKYLSYSYPIEGIRGRYDGGIKIHEDFYLSKRYLTTEQIDLLEKLKDNLPTKETVVIDSILNEFTLCR
ncbi:MAG: HTH domain-containing protein [Romboutsia sp.]|uniref:helix-turn-helix transcriptional regulator n=1 Tax=Cetobacterium sp. TaxID=2071632 RepID=UPI002FC94CF6